ncbi:10086_t:CDS:1, partial [Cetraspora pellucida]
NKKLMLEPDSTRAKGEKKHLSTLNPDSGYAAGKIRFRNSKSK